MSALIVSGTDTGVGKTVVSAMLMLALDGQYWKPVQSGMTGQTDSEAVLALTRLPAERIFPEAYRLREPLSPHRAAELDGITIDPNRLNLPASERLLIVEGAGGVLVPLTRSTLQADLFASWGRPVIVVARTVLGTINHTLLTIEALRRRSIPVPGVVFVGDEIPDTQRTIAELGTVKILGRLPILNRLDADALRSAFSNGFRREDFEFAQRGST